MQWAVGWLIIVECVLPARGEITRLTFAILDVLAEIDALLGWDIEANRLPQVLKRQLTVAILVQPPKELSNLALGSDKAPELEQVGEALILDIIISG